MQNDDRLLDKREIVLRGVIEDKMAAEVVAKMLYLQHVDRCAPITLHIESPGGSVTSGLAILDAIDQITPPVRTCCHRLAGAMATIIAAHGAKGQRCANSASSLSLSAAYVPENAAVEPVDPNAEIDKVNKALIGYVAKDTGRTLEEAARSIRAGQFFSATEAKEFSLIDTIGRCRIMLPDHEESQQ